MRARPPRPSGSIAVLRVATPSTPAIHGAARAATSRSVAAARSPRTGGAEVGRALGCGIACLLAALSMLAPGLAQAGPAEDKLLACMRANIPPTLRIQEFELTSTDRTGGQRLLKGRLYAKREGTQLRAMLKLVAPPDLRNAAYLVREKEAPAADEMYVYLPALNKVRRIKGGAGEGPLFGTDLSYQELKQLQNAFAGNAAKLEGRETVDGQPTRILAITPTAGSGARYDRLRVWVHEPSCVALRVDFLAGAVARKRLSAPAASLAKAGSTWYAAETTMTDLAGGTHTRLRVTGVKSGEELADRYFDQRLFHLGS